MTCPRAGVNTLGTTGLTQHVDRMDVDRRSPAAPSRPRSAVRPAEVWNVIIDGR